jgi:hypothetical protein
MEEDMKSTSVILAMLSVVAAFLGYFLMDSYFGARVWLFMAGYILMIMYNVIIAVERKSDKKFLIGHIPSAAIFVIVFIFYSMRVYDFITWLIYSLVMLVAYVLAFGSLWTNLEYARKNPRKEQ